MVKVVDCRSLILGRGSWVIGLGSLVFGLGSWSWSWHGRGSWVAVGLGSSPWLEVVTPSTGASNPAARYEPLVVK